MYNLTVKIPPSLQFTDDELFQLCSANKELRIERNSTGQIIFMAPSGANSSRRNSIVNLKVGLWNEQFKLGIVTDSAGGFILENSAMRAPDVAWFTSEKWNTFTDEQREKFLKICPDFIVEIRSKSDSLKELQEKLEEWIENGCRLAWLIDPYEQNAHIYRSKGDVQIITSFDEELNGEDVLPKFTFSLNDLR